MHNTLTGDENIKAVEILKTLPRVNSPDEILLSEKDRELLMRFFNCNILVLTHRIFGWKQCS
jgi:hypothetical protein